MKTLEKTMTEFVLEFDKPDNLETDEFSGVYYPIYEYAQFLSTPLTLGMFVCVDEDGNVLEEPNHLDKMRAGWADNPIDENFYKVNAFNKAKQRVIFNGFELIKKGGFDTYLFKVGNDELGIGFKNSTIESLIPYKLKLTDNFKL